MVWLRRITALSTLALSSASANAQASPPQARIRETLRLDANAEDFSAVGPIQIGPRGQIAITFRQDAQVRVYDSTGKRLTTFGRKGQGPGEFTALQVQGWRGDTVWVHDYSQHRLTFITETGKLVRVVSLASALVVTRDSAKGLLSSTFTPHGMLADGSMVGLACLKKPVNGSHLGIVRATTKGEVAILKGTPAVGRCVRGFHYNPLVFSPQSSIRRDASLIADLRVDSMVRKGGTYSLDLFDGAGKLRVTKSFPYVGEPIPRRDVDSLVASMMPSPQNDPEGLARRGVDEAMANARATAPPVYVPITGMMFGQDGTIWIHLRPKAERPSALVLDANGNAVAIVTLPRRSDIVAGSATQVWARERDDDGLTSIVRYQLDGISCARPGCR